MEFVDLLQEHGIPIAPEGHRHNTAGWIQIDCPFCGSGSHKYHMGYNLANRYTNCWSCGYHNLSSTIQALFGISQQQAHTIGNKLSRISSNVPKPRGHLKIPDNLTRMSYSHIKYLRGRGFDPAKLTRIWRLRAMDGRIWIPIYFHGNLVSWTSRSTTGDARNRYMSAASTDESIPHRSILYGFDFVRNAAIVVEGPADVWNVGPGAVATFGVDFTTKQLELMARIPIRAIWFDNSADAQRQANKLVSMLGVLPGDTILITPDKNMSDPGATRKSIIRRIRKEVLNES